MISATKVRKAIDAAASTFEECFQTLSLIKYGEVKTTNRERLLVFQYELGRALFDLDEVYREIVLTKKTLVSRKHAFVDVWFIATMRRLAGYAKAVVVTMRIGKVLGDSFAWFFYQRDAHLLEKHLSHPGQLHTPPGIGGQGELEIIRNVGIFPNHILLYHGITSFLRIGDVSLLHIPTLSISGVAELKTRRLDDKTAQTTVHLIGDKRVLPSRLSHLPSPGTGVPRPRMSAQREDQLKRQIRRIAQLVDQSEPERRASIRNTTNINRLNKFIRQAGSRQLSYDKLDAGLAIVGIRLRRRQSLSTRLLPTRTANVDKVTEPTRAIAMELADPASNSNSLIMYGLGLGYQAGMTPLFWSPIATDVFHALLFQEAAVWSWFNPVHLVRKLRERGFEVETGEMGIPTRVSAARRQGKAIADNLHTYIPLIHQHLFSESGFVDAVEGMFAAVENADLPEHAKVVMKLSQFYGSPPPSRGRGRKQLKSRSGA